MADGLTAEKLARARALCADAFVLRAQMLERGALLPDVLASMDRAHAKLREQQDAIRTLMRLLHDARKVLTAAGGLAQALTFAIQALPHAEREHARDAIQAYLRAYLLLDETASDAVGQQRRDGAPGASASLDLATGGRP